MSKTKNPSRKQLIDWLALALCHVPPNLVALATGETPKWVSLATKECNRCGIRFTKRSKPC